MYVQVIARIAYIHKLWQFLKDKLPTSIENTIHKDMVFIRNIYFCTDPAEIFVDAFEMPLYSHECLNISLQHYN